MRVLWWVLQKSGLDIDDKKALEIESEAAHQTPFNGSKFV